MKFKKHTNWFLKKGYSMENLMINLVNLKDESERIKIALIIQHNCGILSKGEETNDRALHTIIPFFISVGIFLKENDLINLDRKIEQKPEIKKNRESYLG